uniref:Uncharacterized protein n=1 Tax=Anguilla anguilla TaxID=7936 RepID=A0A0E9R9E9_ANGAN
MFNCLTMC